MSPSDHVNVTVDLARVRRNAMEIAHATGVSILAVVKSDAYGLGAERVTAAIADVVDGFCVFSFAEATRLNLWDRTGKPTLVLGPPGSAAVDDYLRRHIRPAVSTADQAAALRRAKPVLCIDTGQQRLACPIEQAAKALDRGGGDEAFTHASRLEQVQMLRAAVQGRQLRLHAAGSSLLSERAAWLDAVRPGLALYRGAARVWARLVECRKSRGPAGYGGFVAPYHGVILAGYSHGLRAGPCLVNGRPSHLLEVGMQSAFVETTADDRPGDEVVLLGDGLSEQEIARTWNASPHECLVRLCGMGNQAYERA